MRRKSLSKILSVVLSAAMLVPQGIYAAGNRSTELPTPDFKWDFEDVTDKQITGTGGIAVLNGTADVSEEAVTAAGVPCLPDGNHVLSLKGGSKGSSYVQLPSGLYEGVTADTGLTWSFWMNAENDVGSYTRAFSSADANGNNEFAYAPYAEDKVWNVILDDANLYRCIYTTEPQKGVWNYITVTLDANRITLYVNGTKVTSSVTSGSADNLTARLNSLSSLTNHALGRTYSRWSDPDCKVRLDDVAVYKTALTAGQVKEIAEQYGLEVPEPKGEQNAQEGTYQDGTKLTLVEDVSASSPDGKIRIKLWKDDADSYYYSVSKNGQTVIECSAFGINTQANDLTTGLQLQKNDVQETEGRETYDLLQGSVSKVDKPYKELSVPFTKGGSRMTVFFKIFNDGMAYRYEVDGDTASTAETTVVTGESSEFSLPDKGTIWTIDPSVTYEAYEYTKRTVAEQYDTEAKYSTPLLASLKEDSGNQWILLSEAAVFYEEDPYAASIFKTSAGEKSIQMTYGQYLVQETDESFDQRRYGPSYRYIESVSRKDVFVTPWRAAVIADDLEMIANSSLITDLNPDAEGDFSWVKLGSSVWPWWSTSADAIDFKAMKDYIDFASNTGIPYVLVDYGWELWENYEEKIADLVSYAEERDVGLLLWYGVNKFDADHIFDLDSEDQIEAAFAWCEKMGVKGVKVDYINSDSDSQFAMNVMYHLADLAAKHHLVLNYHGATNPRGENRTYPNILSTEAVAGAENFKWSNGASISSLLTLPYTRNVIGSMEFTPTAYKVASSKGTAGFMLTMSVVYESAVQTYAAASYVYEGYKGLPFIADVPSVWDESRLLAGYPGEDVVRARRNGEDWYIGAMTKNAANYELALDFLEEGKDYTAYIYMDNADGTDIEVKEQKVTSASTLTMNLPENGGGVVKLSEKNPVKATVYDDYTYYEAEDTSFAVMAGTVKAAGNGYASGLKVAGDIGGAAANRLTFQKVNVPEEGEYELKIYFVSGEERGLYVSVNEEEALQIGGMIGIRGDWNAVSYVSRKVNLQKGDNTICLYNDAAYAPNIDRIAVSKQMVDTVEIPEILADFTFDEDGEAFEGGNAKASGTYTLEEHGDGKALKLNGNGQYLNVTAKDGSSLLTGVEEMTVSYQIRPEQSKTNWGFFVAPDENTQEYLKEHYVGIVDIDGTTSAERYNNNGQRPATASAPTGYGKWYHVTAVYSKNATTLYVDGKQVAEEASSYALPDILGDESILYIGKSTWVGGEYATALIDNYKITSRALTAEEVAEEAAKYNGSEPVIVDKTDLEKAIKDAIPEADKDKYTATSWKIYEDALKKANEVNKDKDATKDEVDAAVKALADAKGKLEPATIDPEPVTLPFVDVSEDDWFYEGVYYDYVNKIVEGKDKTHFAPYENLARAQFAVILHRIAGKPEAKDDASFPDVPAGQWYTDAVLWAAGKDVGVITGYTDSGLFGTADNITREQMAVMMYRYAKFKGYTVNVNADFDKFTDGDKVSGFAKQAMKWAVGNEIITGKDNGTRLDPQGYTSRAECAIIIQRFMETYEGNRK